MSGRAQRELFTDEIPCSATNVAYKGEQVPPSGFRGPAKGSPLRPRSVLSPFPPEMRNTDPTLKTNGKKRRLGLAGTASRLSEGAIQKGRSTKNPRHEKKVRFAEPVILNIADSNLANAHAAAVCHSASFGLGKRALYVVSGIWTKSTVKAKTLLSHYPTFCESVIEKKIV